MADKSPAITLLRYIGKLLPGDFLKTFFYLNFILKPRKMLRLALLGFYRMDHIYDVLREVKARYSGRFTVLEFGTSQGYAFTKMLYATRYLGLESRVTVHGFDTFEGMPAARDRRDIDIIKDGDEWVEGQFAGSYEDLDGYCSRRYSNYALHRGFFEKTLTDEFLQTLRSELPVLVWIDCDYYSSAETAMERLIPYLPNGCIVYFDEYEFNYGSRFTGEARLVYEINHGAFGDNIELVLDAGLSLDSKRVYRFMRFDKSIHYTLLRPNELDASRMRTNDSPLP